MKRDVEGEPRTPRLGQLDVPKFSSPGAILEWLRALRDEGGDLSSFWETPCPNPRPNPDASARHVARQPLRDITPAPLTDPEAVSTTGDSQEAPASTTGHQLAPASPRAASATARASTISEVPSSFAIGMENDENVDETMTTVLDMATQVQATASAPHHFPNPGEGTGSHVGDSAMDTGSEMEPPPGFLDLCGYNSSTIAELETWSEEFLIRPAAVLRLKEILQYEAFARIINQVFQRQQQPSP